MNACLHHTVTVIYLDCFQDQIFSPVPSQQKLQLHSKLGLRRKRFQPFPRKNENLRKVFDEKPWNFARTLTYHRKKWKFSSEMKISFSADSSAKNSHLFYILRTSFAFSYNNLQECQHLLIFAKVFAKIFLPKNSFQIEIVLDKYNFPIKTHFSDVTFFSDLT